MTDILLSNNIDLLREIEISKYIIHNLQIPRLLFPFRDWLCEIFDDLEAKIKNNIYYISLNDKDTIPEIISITQLVTKRLRLVSSTYLPLVYRYRIEDLLCLNIINWLHNEHGLGSKVPFIISNGAFSIYTNLKFPIIYFLPITSQNSILHYPLLFHEFGHVLYAKHEPEMNALVLDFQNKLKRLLFLPYRQNDKKYRNDKMKTSKIIETWFDWLQELFCDAVGLTIGGASYLYAFSIYLRLSGSDEFYVSPENLGGRSHPVSWIRTKLLHTRAMKLGLKENSIKKEWDKIAAALSQEANFHGYYTNNLDELINKTIDDMLVEANPISYIKHTSQFDEFKVDENNFIHLVNCAWNKFYELPTSYNLWEKEILKSYITLFSSK